MVGWQSKWHLCRTEFGLANKMTSFFGWTYSSYALIVTCWYISTDISVVRTTESVVYATVVLLSDSVESTE